MTENKPQAAHLQYLRPMTPRLRWIKRLADAIWQRQHRSLGWNGDTTQK